MAASSIVNCSFTDVFFCALPAIFVFVMLSWGFHNVCYVQQSIDQFSVVTKASGSAIVVNQNTPVVCFSTSCLWTVVKGFLAISAAAGGGGNQYFQCNVWPME